jgi:hypothetical protein
VCEWPDAEAWLQRIEELDDRRRPREVRPFLVLSLPEPEWHDRILPKRIDHVPVGDTAAAGSSSRPAKKTASVTDMCQCCSRSAHTMSWSN